MICDVTLTSKEFSAIHNALCFAPNRGLDATVEAIRKALEGAYRQETDAFDARCAHYNEVAERFGLTSTWSVYDVESLDAPHPYGPGIAVVYSGKENVVVTGDTWADIWRAADKLLLAGGRPYAFIEGFTKKGDNLYMSLGS